MQQCVHVKPAGGPVASASGGWTWRCLPGHAPRMLPPTRVERWGWIWPRWNDPRLPFAALLTLYGVLGFSFFGFNRSPTQMATIVITGSALDVGRVYDRRSGRSLGVSSLAGNGDRRDGPDAG